MARPPKKNLHTRMLEAKTFHDLVKVIAADHKLMIRNLQSDLKRRRTLEQADRARYEKDIRKGELQLKMLEARRQRFERYQANRKIPRALRKRIALLETSLLRAEPGYEAWERAAIRENKKDLAELFEQVERISNPPKPLATVNRSFAVGKDVSSQSITRAYDGHVWEVLKGHFERLPRTKGQRTTFRITATLPEKGEYLQLKERYYTHSLDALVDDAYGIVDELQAELEEAYENMPEGLQGSPVGEARQEAATQLECIASDHPEVPQCLSAVRIVHYPSAQQKSRRDRAATAEAMMIAVAKAAEDHRKCGAKLKRAEAEAIDEFCRQLEEHASELDGVEFPGMFG